MRFFQNSCSILLLSSLFAFSGINDCVVSQEKGKNSLSKKTVEHLNGQLLPALQMGDPLSTVAAISPLYQRLTVDQLEEVNEALFEMKLPTLAELSTDSWIKIVQSGVRPGKMKLSWNETLEVVPILKKRIDESLKAINSHQLMRLELVQPETFEEYEKGLWDLHVFQNDLVATDQLTRFAKSLTVPLRAKLNQKNLRISELQRNALATDYSRLLKQINQLKGKLVERDAEVRVLRVQDAEQILAKSIDTAHRIEAVFAIEYDNVVLNDLFSETNVDKKKKGKRFQSEVLNDSTLVPFIRKTIESARKLAGESGKKSSLLFAGLHWWERGRYGAGPLAGGLLKSREAMNDEEVMFQLFMPREFPVPQDPDAGKGESPTQIVDRRHHYNWQVEYRPIKITTKSTVSIESYKGAGEVNVETRTTRMGRFY